MLSGEEKEFFCLSSVLFVVLLNKTLSRLKQANLVEKSY